MRATVRRGSFTPIWGSCHRTGARYSWRSGADCMGRCREPSGTPGRIAPFGSRGLRILSQPLMKLLVSVRSAAEAQAALTGGASLIDVKEPARGSLGRADAATLTDVLRMVAGRRPVSAALGELPKEGSGVFLAC